MKKIEDVLVLIQARLSSQRAPRKMVRPFAGTTLMDICTEKLLKSKVFPKDNFYLAAHEKELIDIAVKHGANVFHRSEKSARSEGTPMTEMYEWWDKLPFKYCVMVNACCPFLSIETIDNFVKHYLETDSDGLFGVVSRKNYYWDGNKNLVTNWPEGQDCLNTKAVETTYEAAHCLYGGRMDRIGEGIWMGAYQQPNDPELCVIESEFEILDIDHDWQFTMCEAIYKDILKGKLQ